LLSLTAGCGDAAPREDIVRADSAGLPLVTNRAPDRALDWRFEQILDLGGKAEGVQAFHRVHATSIGTDSSRRLYVLDASEYRVTVFDAQGRALRSFGRQGRGPGEFSFPSDLAVADDGSVAVYDFDRGGFIRFASDGTPLPEVVVPGALQRKLAWSPDGRLLGAFQTVRSEGDTLLLTGLLSVGAADTVTLATIASPMPRMASFACMGLSLPPFLAPSIVWAARGARVVVATSAAYALEVHEDGRRAGVWRRDSPLIPANVQLAAAELPSDSFRMMSRAGRCAVSAREAAERIGYAEHAPFVKDLVLARTGELWVLRRTATPGLTRIDVFTANGEYAGTLPGNAPFPAAFRTADEIVTVETDSLDLPHVIVYRVVRAPA
jgi:hypothetical protein